MKQDVAKLVTFGRGGDTLYFSAGNTCRGYGSPEHPHAAINNESHAIPDGCPVLDTRPAVETEAGFRWVMRGPLVNVDLPDGAEDHMGDPSPIMRGAMLGSGNVFGAMLTAQEVFRAAEPAEPGPLDSVCIRVYVEGWRKVGARVGRYVNGRIEWE